MLIFTEQELQRYVKLNGETISVVEEAFTALANGDAIMPPIMRVDIDDQNGEVDIKSAYVKGKEMFAIKVSSGFFDNYKIGLPSASGLMMLIGTQTGVPQALLLDNGYLTEIRTAAAGATAADCLSRNNIETVGVIGTGSQARLQIKAVALVRNFKKLLVYGRSAERAQQYAEEIAAELGVEVQVVESAEQVVRNSELVVTTTPAKEPLIKADWLHPGIHITAMGSDAEHKQELEAAVLAAADKIVCDTKAQCSRLGELHHALESGLLRDDRSVIELGDITSGRIIGRDNEKQITVCDLTGTGVQDTAIALFAYNELTKRNIGFDIKNDKALLKN